MQLLSSKQTRCIRHYCIFAAITQSHIMYLFVVCLTSPPLPSRASLQATLGFEAVESGYLAAVMVPVGAKDVQVLITPKSPTDFPYVFVPEERATLRRWALRYAWL
jgi:hypothetical protein